ncbi:YqiJ family protein [Candidatus Parabeggiatoa sp. HSG14]|uniref:YqiJ family protein n=1 Tax=Candidatus Parabeggiatoa sp. HSG14 TaxID=3055593 RepID=UPI0025A7F212|nr:YqiJ family protein [Thiotrichales bacterium HSG14]
MIFILDPHNMPFTMSLGIMLGIALLEGITTILGFGLSSLLSSFLPDTDIHVNQNIDTGEIGSESSLGKLLSWLNIGRVPIMILLVIFLTVFGLTGYTLQAISMNIVGWMLPALPVALVVFFLALPMVRVLGQGVGKIMPTDETEVISEDTFIGRLASITLGTAKKGRPARAKFKDNYGTTHLIMVEPEKEDEEFTEGNVVVLVERIGGKFLAVRNINPLLEK